MKQLYKVTDENGDVFWTDGDPVAESGDGCQVEAMVALPLDKAGVVGVLAYAGALGDAELTDWAMDQLEGMRNGRGD